ncbi:MAG: PEP-CTERM sorting domain-containing protein [Phycisphaeraceae bacterium]
MKTTLATLAATAMISSSAHAFTILPTEGFETLNDLGPWSQTAGSVFYYNFTGAIDQPSGKAGINFASAGDGAVDLRKSGGTITTTSALTLDTNENPDLTIDLDYVYLNGSTTRRTWGEISLDGGTNWMGLFLMQTGSGVTNENSFNATVTITEGVSGVSLGGTSKTYNGGQPLYDGSTFTDNTLIRFRNGGSAGADLRIFLDNIAITSTDGVPEPGSLALLGLGGLMMIKRRRRA